MTGSEFLSSGGWHLGHFVALGYFAIRLMVILGYGCLNATQKLLTDEDLSKPVAELKEELLTKQRRQRQMDFPDEDAEEETGCSFCRLEFWGRLRDQFKKLSWLYAYMVMYEASAACALGTIAFWGWDVINDVYAGHDRETAFVTPLLILAVFFWVWKGVQSADVVSFYSESRTHSIQQLLDCNILSQIAVSQRMLKDTGHIAWLHKIQVCLLSAPHCVLVLAYIAGKFKDNPDPFMIVCFFVQYINTLATLVNLDGFGDELFYFEGYLTHRVLFRICEFTSRAIVLALLYAQVSFIAFIVVFALELIAYYAYYQQVGYWGNDSHFIMGAVFFMPAWSDVDFTEAGQLARKASVSYEDLHVAYTKIYSFLQWYWLITPLYRRGWITSSAEKREVASMILSRVIDNAVLLVLVVVFSVVSFPCPGCEVVSIRQADFKPDALAMYLVICSVICSVAQFVIFKMIDKNTLEQEVQTAPTKLHPSNPEFWERDNHTLVLKEFNAWMEQANVTMHMLKLKQDRNLTRVYNLYEDWQKRIAKPGSATDNTEAHKKRTNTRFDRFRTMNTRAITNYHVPEEEAPRKAKEVERTPFRDYNINEIRITDELRFFDDFYEEQDPIGEPGAFGIASVCVHRTDPTVKYVVKKILKVKFYTLDPKSREELVETMKNEIEILSMIDHPHVVGLLEVYEDQDWLNLIMEMCKGGELFKKMCEEDVEEPEAARICQHMLLGIHEIHKWDMVHLDLKPENLMYGEVDTLERPANLKLIDFGLARIIPRLQKHVAKRPVGTPYYMAPEIITGDCEFDRSADLWSVGNISFALLFGFPPFFVDAAELGIKPEDAKGLETAIFDMIKDGFTPEIVEDDWGPFFPDDPPVSQYCLDYVAGLLDSDVMTRLTTFEALSHPFFRHHLRRNGIPLSLFCSLTTPANLKDIQIIAAHVYLDRLDKYRVAETIHLFRAWVGEHKDGQKKHRIGKKRFMDRLQGVTRLSEGDCDRCWRAMHMRPGLHENTYLRLEDFLLSTSFVTMQYNDERIRSVFEELDSANEQRLTPARLVAAIDHHPRLGDYKFNAQNVVEQCDSAGRGDLMGRMRVGVRSIKYENFIEQVHPQFAPPFIFSQWNEIPQTMPFDKEEFDAILEEVGTRKVSEYLKYPTSTEFD